MCKNSDGWDEARPRQVGYCKLLGITYLHKKKK